MAQGTVKWFNEEKGYGFIMPQDGTKDIFVHTSALRGIRTSSMLEGQKVSYEVGSGKKGPQAMNVTMA